MATKFGEGYYEIYPKINHAAVNAARAAITKGLGDEFARTQSRMRSDDDRTTRERVSNENRVRSTYKKNNRDNIKDENVLGRLRAAWNKKLLADTKKNEGAFHRLATQFRTIGTVLRGLGVATAVIGGFNTLRIALGGIAAALPLVNAGLIALPSILASAGAEAIILKVAFHGVGTAVKDAFDPKRQKQYNEELKKLAPAARSFVQEIAKLKDLKLPNLQQAFFGNSAVQSTGKQLAPFLKALGSGAAGVAGASGGLLGGITKELTGPRGITAFTFVLKSLALNLRAVTPGLKKFTDGMLTLIFHVSSLGNGSVGKAFSGWLAKIGDFVAHVDVANVFAKATVAAHALGGVLHDVWDILAGIVKALNVGQAWTGFTNLIHTIATFVKSGQGQIFLTQISNTLSTLSTLVSSLTGSALKLVAGAFAAFYPKIKPLADIIAKIGRDLVPLGPVIGQIIANAFVHLTSVLKDLEPAIKNTVGWIVDHKDAIAKVADKVLLVVAAFIAFKKVQGFAKPILDGLANIGIATGPQALVILGLAALAFSIWYAYHNSQTFREESKKLQKNLEDLGNSVGIANLNLAKIGKAIMAIPVGTLIGDLAIINFWLKVVRITIDALKRAFDNMKHWMVEGFGKVQQFFLKTLPGWFSTMRWLVAHVLDDVKRRIGGLVGHVKAIFTSIRDFITKTLPGWFSTARWTIAHIFDNLKDRAAGARDRIKERLTGLKDFITKTLPSWFSTGRWAVAHIFDNIKERAGGLRDKIKEKLNPLKNFFTQTIPGWAETCRKALLNTWKVLVDNVHFWWRKVWNTIRDTVVGIGNKVLGGDGKSGFQKVWNSMFGVVGGLVKMKVANINNIPRMASGGPVKGPGGPKSDQIPIWASNGEFMVNADATKRHYALLHAINSGADVRGGFAAGGAVSAIEALQRAVGPALGVTSTTGGRHAKNSYHYRGMAVDFSSGSKRAMDAAAANLMKFSAYILELIHSPNWFVKNYHKTGRGTYAGVYAAHFNHVHLAMTRQAAEQALKDLHSGKIKAGGVGFGPGGVNLPALVEQLHKSGAKKYFKPVYDLLGGVPGGKQPWKGLAKHPIDLGVTQVNKAVADMVAQAQAAAAAQSSVGGAPTNLATGPHGGQIKSWIAQASRFANIPPSWVQGLMYIISRESGGNPRAYNNTPVGNQHAEGIMQTLPSTFHQYHARSTSNNIYDPVANIAAAVNYIHGRYGTVFNTPWLKHTGNYYAKGGLIPTLFDSGGYLPPKSMTLAANNTSNWEKVGGGMPSKIILDLGDNKTIEFMMDDRIAKYEDEIIKYSATR